MQLPSQPENSLLELRKCGVFLPREKLLDHFSSMAPSRQSSREVEGQNRALSASAHGSESHANEEKLKPLLVKQHPFTCREAAFTPEGRRIHMQSSFLKEERHQPGTETRFSFTPFT